MTVHNKIRSGGGQTYPVCIQSAAQANGSGMWYLFVHSTVECATRTCSCQCTNKQLMLCVCISILCAVTTVILQLDAAATIFSLLVFMQLLFEGGVYLLRAANGFRVSQKSVC